MAPSGAPPIWPPMKLGPPIDQHIFVEAYAAAGSQGKELLRYQTQYEFPKQL